MVFRHGDSNYEQGNEPVAIEVAGDLTEEGIGIVEKKADEVRTHFVESDFFITSSPAGRCLHTAKVIEQRAVINGLLPYARIIPNPELSEVGNFNWKWFSPLCVGGEVEMEGERFVIDVNDSNPRGISSGEYFYYDFAHALPRSIKKKWPAAYLSAIGRFERAADVRKRMRAVLCSLTRQPMRQIVVVTHDALCGFLVRIFTRGKETELAKGSYLVLKGNADKLVVGDSITTVFDQF